MPPKARQASLRKEQLIYLAGIFDATTGMRSTNSNNAVAISKKEEWPEFMAKTYGGEHRQFVSNAGKDYWGWFLSLDKRLELYKLLEEATVIMSLDPYERDGVRAKLEKAAGRLQ